MTFGSRCAQTLREAPWTFHALSMQLACSAHSSQSWLRFICLEVARSVGWVRSSCFASAVGRKIRRLGSFVVFCIGCGRFGIPRASPFSADSRTPNTVSSTRPPQDYRNFRGPWDARPPKIAGKKRRPETSIDPARNRIRPSLTSRFREYHEAIDWTNKQR
jgi:hypothetical protein